MKKKQTNITYTIVNPNADGDTIKMLKQAIVEKLAFIHKQTLIATN